MSLPILIAIASPICALAVASAFRISNDLRPGRRAVFGRVETWREDGTADAVWWFAGLPIVRQSWTHSTHLSD